MCHDRRSNVHVNLHFVAVVYAKRVAQPNLGNDLKAPMFRPTRAFGSVSPEDKAPMPTYRTWDEVNQPSHLVAAHGESLWRELPWLVEDEVEAARVKGRTHCS
jgi:hypothetical protein